MAFCTALVASCLFALPAQAKTLDELEEQYQIAVTNLEYVQNQQNRNDQEIAQTQHDIDMVEAQAIQAQETSDRAAIALYKNSAKRDDLIGLMLESGSLTEAIERYESYERIEEYCVEMHRKARIKQAELDILKRHLDERKAAIAEELAAAQKDVDDAEKAIENANHADGDQFHQLQGNGSNCGATSFIVGVNVLLHENRFKDNVAVWESESFGKDSTTAIATKGAHWLKANELDDVIAIETVKGDIRTTDQLREQLDESCVVVISSGSGSVWQRADGEPAEEGSFPDGHYMLVYWYDGEGFYVNDSSVKAEQGAGVLYTEEQMQQWLDGRGTHFAVVMYTL